ncbi:fluoride efflux transporter FluC [Micrococcoides hystricis]|uniref:Fluoride-specific ion channel FluC n=1 Tax=Micrococcoides hystricis TaxID=1572761 RepID=A0ABV6PDS7_9MICC
MAPVLWVFLGGGLGTAARYGVQLLLGEPGQSFDTAIFAVNVAGAFGLGAIQPWLKRMSAAQSGFIGPGFFGGFTTYSALMVSPVVTARAGDVSGSITYFLVSLAAGLVAAWLGIALTKSRHRG